VRSHSIAAVAAVLVLSVAGCRGGRSEETPFHLSGDMDWQPKKDPQQSSPVFADGRAMRPLVEGTVAQGHLKEDDAYWRGTLGGKPISRVPVSVDMAMLERGRDRYSVFCAPCHDEAGAGLGMAVQRGMPPPIALGSDRVQGMKDGEIFAVISDGVRNMPSYKNMIPVEDRWAIITWVRVLSRSQWAHMRDVPAAEKGSVREAGEL